MERKYREFSQDKSGTAKERLGALGFVYSGKDVTIQSYEEFTKALEECDYMDEQKLVKYYGEYLTYSDISHILKIGTNGLCDNEIAETFKIIPCTPTQPISVREFIKLLYE
ncbi:hypothetical protein ECANGB1_238 [Enterospora canceri]|uniref:Uncharacterized protein n=1 Tax=Enterospora canceri TaxID=1081671 RepID=A0A1Y1S855_9MICR|nr:hypothetical protein ECANGB1_238 [Enterospora canceri]